MAQEQASRSFPTSRLKCCICGLRWTIYSQKLMSARRMQGTEKFCENCFNYVNINCKTLDISSDPYDVRNWIKCSLPIHLFHCCSCSSVHEHSLMNVLDGLIDILIYIPEVKHRYCLFCFNSRIHNPQEGLSPYGCCIK